MSKMTSQSQQRPVEVLTFWRGLDVATIVSDGEQTRVFERQANTAMPTLSRAIGYLEAAGYSIDNDNTTW